jgi:FKBP-type peptidyl-prolyl cis-trans isomerase (trigger factor)
MDALLQANPVEVPRELIHREIEHLMQSTRQNMEQRGLKVNEICRCSPSGLPIRPGDESASA